ncbi:MAG: hypothetical protein FWG02_10745 [Holophagaceae bacterium]|nr:hypothetical protein [Holophagaceae bacterium]
MPPSQPNHSNNFRHFAPELCRIVFNIRIVALYPPEISETRATNAVLASLIEGIEGYIFPVWATNRDGDEYEISLFDLEIYP